VAERLTDEDLDGIARFGVAIESDQQAMAAELLAYRERHGRLEAAVREWTEATQESIAAGDAYAKWASDIDPGSDYRTRAEDAEANRLAGACTEADDRLEAAVAALRALVRGE
jgi:hypothetical protein